LQAIKATAILPRQIINEWGPWSGVGPDSRQRLTEGLAPPKRYCAAVITGNWQLW